MTRRAVLLVSLLALAVDARANTFFFTAELRDGAAAADGVFSVDLRLIDNANATVWSEQQPNVVVADGLLAIDIGSASALPPVVPVDARLVVTVEGDELEPIALAVLARVARARRVASATTAGSTDLLGGVTSSTAARRSLLRAADAGSTVHFSNLSGVPADIADGDDGTVIGSASNGVTHTAATGALALTSVQGTDFGTQQIPASRFNDNSIDTSRVAAAAVTREKVGTDLDRADFNADVGLAQILSTPLFRVTATSCVDRQGLSGTNPIDAGILMTTSTCIAEQCAIPGDPFGRLGRRSCTDFSNCQLINPSTCANVGVGSVVTP